MQNIHSWHHTFPPTQWMETLVKHTDKCTVLAASHITVYIQVREQKDSIRKKKLFFLWSVYTLTLTLTPFFWQQRAYWIHSSIWPLSSLIYFFKHLVWFGRQRHGTFSCVLMHLMTFVCPFQVSDNVRLLFFKREERAGLMVYSTNKRVGKSVQHFTIKTLHCLGKTVAVRQLLDLLHTRKKQTKKKNLVSTLHLDLLCNHWSCY